MNAPTTKKLAAEVRATVKYLKDRQSTEYLVKVEVAAGRIIIENKEEGGAIFHVDMFINLMIAVNTLAYPREGWNRASAYVTAAWRTGQIQLIFT
jgi:hypothetical protein